MSFTLDFKNLPFKPNGDQVIYLPGDKEEDEKITRLVEWNFPAIRDHYESLGLTFCYIPYVRESVLHGERFHYVAPFAKAPREATYMVTDNFMLDYLANPEDREKATPMLVIHGIDETFFAVKLTEDSFADGNLGGALEELLKEKKPHKPFWCHRDNSDIRFSISSKWIDEDDELPYIADEHFDFEARQLVKEIQERVDRLQVKGFDLDLIELMFGAHKRRLSRLLVTKDLRICLPDYFGMEIRMTPLPKAVYLLFLRHPEGIPFKSLADYRDELVHLYKRVNYDMVTTDMLGRIDKITDPLDNSINVQCSRIREAFVSKFDEHLANNYFITGRRGEPKGIILPRKMVKWEVEI